MAFGAAGSGAPAVKSEADAVGFTCAARENPKSRMVRSLIQNYIGCGARWQYRRKRRFRCRSMPYSDLPRGQVSTLPLVSLGSPTSVNENRGIEWIMA